MANSQQAGYVIMSCNIFWLKSCEIRDYLFIQVNYVIKQLKGNDD